MQIPHELRMRFASELKFVSEKMRTETDPMRQMYFFSAAYGEATRILNFTWDSELALVQVVLQNAHNAITSRLDALVSGRDTRVKLPGDYMNNLAQVVQKLADVVKGSEDREIHSLLCEIAKLTYLSTGNGNYLYEKGLLKL